MCSDVQAMCHVTGEITVDKVDPEVLDRVLEPYMLSQTGSLESLESQNQPSLRAVSKVTPKDESG